MKQEVLPPLIKKKYDTVAFQKFLKVTIVLLLIARLFLLSFTKIPEVLGQRFEVTTSITSLKKLKEGLYLFQHGLDPYEGGIFTQVIIFKNCFINNKFAYILFLIFNF